MKLTQKGILAPKGFQASGAFVGIKKQKKDMALIYSERPCTYGGAFTQNTVKAAPVLWDEKQLKRGEAVHAVVVNSGNANAVTGEVGKQDTETMATKVADVLHLEKEQVLVCSTGVIGVTLPMPTVEAGIEKVCSLLEGGKEAAADAAEAILTTDTFVKDIAIESAVDGVPFYVGAMGKGSGMIHPNMATMLAFVTTDIAISQPLLQKAVSKCIHTTFNMITVDGDTSTNDSVIVLANGACGNPCIETEGAAFDTFCEALYEALKYVAISIVKDGEGATKLLEVQLTGAATYEQGKTLAKSILTSSLVKTAFFGEDANWGRILAAMGYAGVAFNAQKTVLSIQSSAGEVVMFRQGLPVKFSETKAKKILEEKEIVIAVTLEEGTASVTAWGCDLSYDYVKINGEYRS